MRSGFSLNTFTRTLLTVLLCYCTTVKVESYQVPGSIATVSAVLCPLFCMKHTISSFS